MAFRKDKTTAAQTSANAAGTVVAALVAQGAVSSTEEAEVAAVAIFDALFERLGPIVEADNKVFEQAEASEPAAKSTSRGRKTGGGKSSGKRGAPSLDKALEMVMRSGAFEGLSLAEILEVDADEADADYDYGDGERTGKDYISWLATEKNKNEFTRDYARVVAEAEGLV